MPRTLHPAVVYRRKAPTVRLTDTTQLGNPLLLLWSLWVMPPAIPLIIIPQDSCRTGTIRVIARVM